MAFLSRYWQCWWSSAIDTWQVKMDWDFVDSSLLSRRWSGAFPCDGTALRRYSLSSASLCETLHKTVRSCGLLCQHYVADVSLYALLYVFRLPFWSCYCLDKSKWMGRVESVQFQTKKDQQCNKAEMSQGVHWYPNIANNLNEPSKSCWEETWVILAPLPILVSPCNDVQKKERQITQDFHSLKD